MLDSTTSPNVVYPSNLYYTIIVMIFVIQIIVCTTQLLPETVCQLAYGLLGIKLANSYCSPYATWKTVSGTNSSHSASCN